MNAKKLFLGLLTATFVMTPFASIQPASARGAGGARININVQPKPKPKPNRQPQPKQNQNKKQDKNFKTTFCKKPSPAIKEDLRNIRVGADQGKQYKNAGGRGGTILPSPGKNQEYREFDLDTGNKNVANRGTRRAVALQTRLNNGKIMNAPIYITYDHYRTFCRLGSLR